MAKSQSTHKGEFQPAAENPTYGSQDFCLIVDGDLKEVRAELEAKHANIISDIVERHGSCGTMPIIYLRDPDGQLTEQREQSHARMSFAES